MYFLKSKIDLPCIAAAAGGSTWAAVSIGVFASFLLNVYGTRIHFRLDIVFWWVLMSWKVISLFDFTLEIKNRRIEWRMVALKSFQAVKRAILYDR